MSQNVAEGNAAFVIWSNECLDWDNWSEAFEEDYSYLTEEEKYRLMEELNGDYLDDERRNLDIRVGTPILIIADIGRWDGRHTGYREIESAASRTACIRSWTARPGMWTRRATCAWTATTTTATITISTASTGRASARRPRRTSKKRFSTTP